MIREYSYYQLQNEGVQKNSWFDLYRFNCLDNAKNIMEDENKNGLNHRIIKRTIKEELINEET